MVSKNQIKFITGLHQKKYRSQHRAFIAEGQKVISELLESNFGLQHLYVTEELFREVEGSKRTLISDGELRKISALTVPNNCLAVFDALPELPPLRTGLIAVLDDIRDPGNFGTILRLCDW